MFIEVFSTGVAVGCYGVCVRYVGWLRFDNSKDCEGTIRQLLVGIVAMVMVALDSKVTVRGVRKMMRNR